MLAGLESRQTVLRGVLERKEGLPAGARGLLAGSSGYRSLTELLVVRPGYERAVAAALGATIQAVVMPERRGSERGAACGRVDRWRLLGEAPDFCGGRRRRPGARRAPDLWELRQWTRGGHARAAGASCHRPS